MSTQHEHSHKVYIRRKSSHLEKIQSNVPEYQSRAKRYIGSYYVSTTSREIGSGLTHEEKKLLLPPLIGIEPTDRDWNKEVNKFYHELVTEIPFGNGRMLEIGLEKGGSKLSKDNMPINVSDYIRYHQIKGHVKVAENEEEVLGNLLKEYYIYDPKESKKSVLEKADKVDKANSKYLAIKDKPEIVKALLIAYKVNPDTIEPDEYLVELQKKVQSDPETLLREIDDEQLITKAFISLAVEYKVLSIVDSSYFYNKENKKLGNNLNETISWFADTNNVNTVTLIRTEVREIREERKKKK